MLESMKVLGFIPESKAIKLYKNADGKVVGERYDKVTYLREFLNFTMEGEGGCYVEAESFLSLLPFISRATIKENYLEVVLKNGAEYKFPYMEVEFNAPKIEPPTLEIKGEIDFFAFICSDLGNFIVDRSNLGIKRVYYTLKIDPVRNNTLTAISIPIARNAPSAKSIM